MQCKQFHVHLMTNFFIHVWNSCMSSNLKVEHSTQKIYMAFYLLHGTLIARILGIDRVPSRGQGLPLYVKPNNDGAEKKTRKLLSQIKRACLCRPRIIGTRFYATIDLEKARAGRTRTIDTEAFNPQWKETFRIYCAHWISNVIFTVKDDNPVGATLIGRAYLSAVEIIKGFEVEKWIEIRDEVGSPIPGGYKIHVKLQFFNVNQDPNWSHGIKTPEFTGVPHTFFRQRKGCQVTLYQDAHIPDDEIAEGLKSIGLYESNRCWEDIFEAIYEAKHFIYITGWSVYTKITLIRDPHRPKLAGGDLTLGELLKKKAEEGVRVLMLVWDDRTSVGVLKRDGLMETHDQDTLQYFQFTHVHCVLCPRIPGYGESIIQGLKVSTMFTHHQKTILVDCEVQSGRSEARSLVSFLGGIDLCDGRYDTRDHPLFRTLDTTHKDDFHQPNFPGASINKGGPREPWHDIHCRIEGPAAWDVLYNFEQRWQKQVGRRLLFSMSELYKFLIRPAPVTASEDADTWNVQVFRSIDIGAVNGFPENPGEAFEIGLVTGKGNVIDRSVQDAYINAIRRAKNFIYIENQYFLGSSYGWEKRGDIKIEDINALHLIPRELSLKVASKIEAGERFTVYIVIPMWPESIAESASVQAILDWQRRTMEMMYKDIANALKAKGISNVDLREYLTFFCLGNREAERAGEYTPPEHPDPDTDYIRAQESRRFMIYVHAKMMIVDDEYIVIGSANINQRSMDGARDTEIAIGAYQPHHLTSNTQGGRGKIHGFRMALWLEHLGRLHEDFENPENLACVRRVNEMADEYWHLYSSETWDNSEDLLGHLLRYPVNVSSIGEISVLPGFEHFPDTKARVLGTKSDVLLPILTT